MPTWNIAKNGRSKNNPQWQQTWSRPELQGNDRFNIWPKSVFLAGKSGPHAKKSSPTPLWGHRLPVSDLAGWISTGWPWINLILFTNHLVLVNCLFSPTPSYQMEGLIYLLTIKSIMAHWAKIAHFGFSRHPWYFRVSVGIWMSMR